MIEHRQGMQRVDVGNQVPADAIGIDQFDYPNFLGFKISDLIARNHRPIAIGVPAERDVSYAEVNEDVVIKPRLSNDQFMNTRQERAGFSTLNNSMIVSAANSDCFADAQLR